MVAPLIAGAAISAGSAILGGLLGNKSGRRQAQREYEQQKEFAQHGVRWRVEDAKAAGLHPLYALGAQLPTFSPSFQTDQGMGPALSEAGQHIGRAVSAGQTAAERQIADLQIEAARKGIEEADARIGALNSEAFRNMQEANAATAFPSTVPNPLSPVVPEGQAPSTLRGMTQVTPTETPTIREPGIMAGTAPLFREFEMPGGLKMLLPGGIQGDASEALESVAENEAVLAAVIGYNLWHYGADWIKKAARDLPMIGDVGRARVRSSRRARGHGPPKDYRTGGEF